MNNQTQRLDKIEKSFMPDDFLSIIKAAIQKLRSNSIGNKDLFKSITVKKLNSLEKTNPKLYDEYISLLREKIYESSWEKI